VTKPVQIFFFGDSVCVGQHVSVHSGWVTRVSADLAQLGGEHGFRVVVSNASANGRTTREALLRMPYEIQTKSPDILVVQFGMNDCNYWETDRGIPRVSPGAFAANLEEIIVRAKHSGVSRVLLNTNHPTARTEQHMPGTRMTYEESNRRYNELIRRTAANVGDGVLVNDMERAFDRWTAGGSANVRDLVLPEPDLLHLSEQGHDLYYKVTYPLLADLVVKIIQSR